MLMVAFFLNSAIAPNGLEVSMGARETVRDYSLILCSRLTSAEGNQ